MARTMYHTLVSLVAVCISAILLLPPTAEANNRATETQQVIYNMLLQVRDLQEQIIATGNYQLLSQTAELLEQIGTLQTQTMAVDSNEASANVDDNGSSEVIPAENNETNREEDDSSARITERMVLDTLAAWRTNQFDVELSPDLVCDSETDGGYDNETQPQSLWPQPQPQSRGVETLEIEDVQVTLENGQYVCEDDQWTPKVCRYDRFDNCIPMDEPPLGDRQVHQPCEAPDGAWYPETVRAQIRPIDDGILGATTLNQVRLTCNSGQITQVRDGR